MSYNGERKREVGKGGSVSEWRVVVGGAWKNKANEWKETILAREN